MMRSLVEKYQTGMITDDQLVVESLNVIDPNDPGSVLNGLPENIIHRILGFANDYVHGRMVTNFGLLREADQVFAARQWIEKSLKVKVQKTA
jgi:hypothetical protein